MTTTRTSLAILGAGPVGLEAALAAVDQGLDFTLYEAGPAVGHHVRGWGHVRLFTPWELDASPRARRHLTQAGVPLPEDGVRPTGAELVEHLLEPLAALPAVASALRTDTRVLRIGREGLLKSDEIGTGGRAGRPFRLLLRDRDGVRVEHADAVLDCTGTWGHPNPLGRGGIPAPGEEEAASRMVRHIPREEEVAEWAGERILLVGAGHSAQTAARLLADAVTRWPGTTVLWALRSEDPRFAVEGDSLPARAALHADAERLAAGSGSGVPTGFEAARGATVEALRPESEGVVVTLATAGGTREERVDRIVSLTGSVGDADLYRQLQVHECYATSGPMNLSAALLGADAGADCMAQPTLGADALRNPEPQFFILGSKSYGRNSTFLLRTGWEQVDAVVPLVAEELRELERVPDAATAEAR